jgi:Domain of unknown function (DUF929)
MLDLIRTFGLNHSGQGEDVARERAKTRLTNERQAKVAAMRAQEAAKRRRILMTLGATGLIVVVVLTLVVVKLTASDSSSTGSGSTSAAGPVIEAVTTIPSKVFDQVGTGTVQALPTAIPGNQSLASGGKPRVLYVGAEYCPYCAAERWAVVAALSRFGTFTNLGQTASSSKDIFPSTATLSFHGSSYSSKYVDFAGYELQSNQQQGGSYAPLDKLSAADQKVFATFNAPPYVSSQSAGSIPFIDFGGKYMISGASYDPGELKGMTHLEIAQSLAKPDSPVAKSVVGAANLISAAVCHVTGGDPASVCSSSGVTAAATKLGSGG